MKLMIVDDDGTAHEVIDDLDQYDLSKPMARGAVIDEVQDAMDRIREVE